MSVQRARHPSELAPPERTDRDPAALIESAFRTAFVHGRGGIVRGVMKFRSIEEAQQSRRQREAARARALLDSNMKPT